jgi:glyoxylase-like metal-dependent hydrolase (beta-lactamase superfamily II)
LPAAYAPFEQGYDILGDGSLLGVSLPGHAPGQLGLFLHDQFSRSVLLAADACWHSRTYRELIYPHRLTIRLQADSAAYRETLRRLHQLHRRKPDLTIVPFHCPEVVTTTPYFR